MPRTSNRKTSPRADVELLPYMAVEGPLHVATHVVAAQGDRKARSRPDVTSRHAPYAEFCGAIGTLREEFHRIGRFDDANA